ncbi:hypothetical protein B0H19DRAFT_1235408 [Mycena capillaripes]|nr:hypothetical protein B0H19DRAFT_1235408 [Mycena capillaripes]
MAFAAVLQLAIVVPDPDLSALRHKIHLGGTLGIAWLISHRRQAPVPGIALGVVGVRDHLFNAVESDSIAGRERDQRLSTIQKGEEFLTRVLAQSGPSYGAQSLHLWWTPAVAAQCQKDAATEKQVRLGNPTAAYEYSEFTTPPESPWWTCAVRSLYREAQAEEQDIKDEFRRKYRTHPIPHPDRAARSPLFMRACHRLSIYLACTQAVFWIRTRIQEGTTAADVARAGALTGACAAAAASAARFATAEYTRSLMTSTFLGASLGLSSSQVSLWGTQNNPRNPPPSSPSPLGLGYTIWGNGGGWGSGGGWGQPKRRRWFPKHYGYRRMGAIFRPPRRLRAKPTIKMRWLQHVERKWRRIALALHNLTLR